jgi:transketolase
MTNGQRGQCKLSVEEMSGLTRSIRRHIVEMTAAAGSGHPGGSLSAVEILTALYFNVLKHDPNEPDWPGRDRFILSKGHCTPVLYSTLAEAGYFPVDELSTFRQVDSRLHGHCHNTTPGVEHCSGSLGQGLSVGIGMALAGRLDVSPRNVYVLLGDGECDEGQVWEAAMAASHFGLDNLTVIVDRNGIQNDRWTHEAMNLEPLPDKWRAFGWDVHEVDGHDLGQMVEALYNASQRDGKRHAIIAGTVKGKGVSFMENNPGFHGKAPNADELKQALEEIG